MRSSLRRGLHTGRVVAQKPVSAPLAGCQQAFNESMADPEAFWAAAAKHIHWETQPRSILKKNNPQGTSYTWFEGGMTNSAFNALDRHVSAGRGNNRALIYDSPVTNTKRVYTYAQLLSEVETAAGMLRSLGVKKGDKVAIYFPAVPEVTISVLACARIGAISTTIFGGFASHELALRLDDFQPKIILAGSVGLEGAKKHVSYKPLIDGALSQVKSRSVEKIVMLQRPEERADIAGSPNYLDWDEEMKKVRAKGLQADPVWLESNAPQYVKYTSGTTSRPKGVVRDTGGHITALNWTMESVFGIKAGQSWWANSDPAWVVGSSYGIWAPLLKGASTILFEGKPVGTPDSGAFWRVADEYGVHAMFTAPTAIRAILREDPDGKNGFSRYPMKNLHTLVLAGERSDPDTLKFAEKLIGAGINVNGRIRAVKDQWWMTELGWPAIAHPTGLGHPEIVHGSAGFPVPGWNMKVLSPALAAQNEKLGTIAETFQLHSGNLGADPTKPVPIPADTPNAHHHRLNPNPLLPEAPAGELGPLCIRLPLPPGALMTLWGDEKRFEKGYTSDFPGYFHTGDAAIRDPKDGRIHIMARADDVLNIAAHRVSSGAIEAAVSSHNAVAECAVIGPHDELRGQVPWGVVVLKRGFETADKAKISKEIADLVRAEVGPIAAFKTVVFVNRLPKTRSGKVLRATMKAIADKQQYNAPATIDDPAVLGEIEAAFKLIKH